MRQLKVDKNLFVFVFQSFVVISMPFFYFKISISLLTPGMSNVIAFTIFSIIVYTYFLVSMFRNWIKEEKEKYVAIASFGMAIFFLIILSLGLVAFSPYLSGFKVYWEQEKIMSFYMKTTGKNIYIGPEFNEGHVYYELSRLPKNLVDDATIIFKQDNSTYYEGDKLMILWALHDKLGDYIKVIRPDFTAEVIAHELGHSKWIKLSKNDRQWWIQHWNETTSVSEYGSTNFEEDFAETFQCYIFPEAKGCWNQITPEKLKIIKKVMEE